MPSVTFGRDRYFYANTQSCQAKVGECEYLIARGNIDVVGIMETWWNAENEWIGYRRTVEAFWRWVAIYVKERVELRRIEIRGGTASITEPLWIKLLGSRSDEWKCANNLWAKPEGALKMRIQRCQRSIVFLLGLFDNFELCILVRNPENHFEMHCFEILLPNRLNTQCSDYVQPFIVKCKTFHCKV